MNDAFPPQLVEHQPKKIGVGTTLKYYWRPTETNNMLITFVYHTL